MDVFQLVGKIIIDNEDAIDGIGETSGMAKKAEDIMSKAFKTVGSAVTTYLSVSAITNFGKACIGAAADAQAMESQFTQVFTGVEETARTSLTNIADTTGISENRMKSSYTQIAAFAKTTGMETADAMALADRAMVAVADSAAFYDRSLESVTESLRSFLKGNYENDAALGLSCTEITRNEAANRLYGKSFIELSEAQKQLTLLQMVEDANALSGALGQAARESDTWANQTGNLKQAWTDLTAIIGGKFLPVAIEIVAKIAEIVGWMTEHETIMSVLGVVIGTLVTALTAYNIALALAAAEMTLATAAGAAFGAVMAFITSPVTLTIAAIGALIAIGVALYENWDQVKAMAVELGQNLKAKFSEMVSNVSSSIAKLKNDISAKFNAIKESVSTKVSAIVSSAVSKFNEIKTGIQEKIEAAREAVKSAIDKMRSFFNFSWSLPKIKMPKVSISGEFSLSPPSVPKFSLSWYKKAYESAMVLKDPTIFGYSAESGKFLGGGEGNGNEVVAGEAHLMNLIQEAVSAQNQALEAYLQTLVDMLADYFPQVIAASSHDIVTDDGAIIARYAPKFNTALGRISMRKDRGR